MYILCVIAGSKELLLEQRVPASYLALEDVISHLAADRRHTGVDPVLNAEQYKAVVTTEMQYRYQRSFRDAAELHQATLFLHENGVCHFSFSCSKLIENSRKITACYTMP